MVQIIRPQTLNIKVPGSNPPLAGMANGKELNPHCVVPRKGRKGRSQGCLLTSQAA